MNLRQIANNLTRVINPNVMADIFKSDGKSITDDGSISPNFLPPVQMLVQKQAITQSDLGHVDNINIQGKAVSIYTNGNWCGLDRKEDEGGDIFIIGDEVWLVISVPEIWPDWTKVIAVKQLDDKDVYDKYKQ